MDLETIFQGKMTQVKWNALGRYLKGQQFHPGTGLIMEESGASGFCVSAIKKRDQRQSQHPPFAVMTLQKIPETATYSATLQEGWVIERHTQEDADAVVFHEVDIASSPMSTRPRPEITLSDGDFVSVQYDTDDEGYIISTPVIEIGAEQESDHHQPPSGEGTGVDGTYYVKLFQFRIIEGAPQLVVYQQSDIEHSRLWTGRNIGGERYIHKEWDGESDRYDFRTLKQIEPGGISPPDYGKIIVDPVGDEFDDVNDSIKFSCLVEKNEDPQINIDDDGAGTITIKGNNKSGSLYWEYCEENESQEVGETLLTWEDGLITNTNPNASFKAGCGNGLPSGSQGDMLYHDGTDWVLLASPAVAATLETYVLTNDGGAGGVPTWTETDTP